MRWSVLGASIKRLAASNIIIVIKMTLAARELPIPRGIP